MRKDGAVPYSAVMSWVSRLVEQRLANAAAAGELDTPTLAGKPLPDLDEPRPQGWWADQFATRELSHDRRKDAEAAMAVARSDFWRAASVHQLHERVRVANGAIEKVNLNLIDTDQLELFDFADVEARWRRVQESR